MSAVGLFLRETLELGYFAFFLPSRLQQRLNEWLPTTVEVDGTQKQKNTRPVEMLTRWRAPRARRFLAQCAVWWVLGLVPLWVVGCPRLPLGLLVALSFLLPIAGWGLALLDISTGLLGPTWMGLAWATHPAIVGILEEEWFLLVARLLPWLDWLTGGLTLLGTLVSGLVGGVLGRWMHVRTGKDIWGWVGAGLAALGTWVTFAAIAARSATNGAALREGSLVLAGIGAFVVAGILAGGGTGKVSVGLVGGVTFSVVFIVAGGVVGGEAGVVAFVLASGFAVGIGNAATPLIQNMPSTAEMVGALTFIAAFALVGNEAGGVAFGAAFGWAFLAALFLAIALTTAVADAASLAVVVAGPLVISIAALAAAAPGSIWLVWLLAAWGLSACRRIGWLLLLLVALPVMVGFAQGWAAAGLAFVITLAGALRLWSALAAAVAGTAAFIRLGHAPALHLLPKVPPFSDEIVWIPVPFLDRLLVQALSENQSQGIKAIYTVAGSLQQWRAARRALRTITIGVLQEQDSLRAIAQAETRLPWLPADLRPLGHDAREVLPRLLQVSKSVAAALESPSPYNRRLALKNAADDLNTMHANVRFLAGRAGERCWQPVIERWQQVLAAALDQSPDQEIPNPYETGNPLRPDRAALFRGRRDLTDAVTRALLERGRPALVLYGPRRMGKTSFLLQMARLLGGRTVPVFVDLLAPASTRSTCNFLYTLARAMVSEARVGRVELPAVEWEDFQNADPFVAFERWLQERALPALGDRQLLLMLDEFEKLGQAIDAGRVEEAVLDQLRSLTQLQRQLSFLFAGVAKLDELGPRWSSHFINVRALRVAYLEPPEAAELIRNPDPASGFSLVYDDAVAVNILAWTHCHPYLVQLLCADVVREANARRTKRATMGVFEAAIERALESGEPYFRNVWDEMTGVDAVSIAAGQVLLRRMANATGPLPVALQEADAATRRAVDRLTRLDVIEEIAGGYRFEVPLVRRWVAERAPTGFE